jgi:hypothetical protein
MDQLFFKCVSVSGHRLVELHCGKPNNFCSGGTYNSPCNPLGAQKCSFVWENPPLANPLGAQKCSFVWENPLLVGN